MPKYLICFLLLALFSCDKKAPSSGDDPSEGPLFTLLSSEETGVRFDNHLQEDPTYNVFNLAYIYNGTGAGVGDFNNDGLPDLYLVAIRDTNRLYINRGDFQFEEITLSAGVAAVGGLKTGVSLVDINGDGWLDIYQCRMGRNPEDCRNALFINNGDLTFTEKAADYGLTLQAPSTQANFFDYDLDGDLDVYIVNHLLEYEQTNNIRARMENGRIVKDNQPQTAIETDRLLRNNGGETFTDVTGEAGLFNRAFGLSATVSDFNDDGYPDLYLANDFIEGDALYINNQDGTFSNQINDYLSHTSNSSMGSDIADINNDGLQDLMVLDMLPPHNARQKQLKVMMENSVWQLLVQYDYGLQLMRNTLHLNNGNGTFSDVACLAGVHATDWSWAPLMMDYDNDGHRDIFVTNGYRRDFTDMDFVKFILPEMMGQKMDFNEAVNQMPSHKLRNFLFQNQGGLRFRDRAAEWGMDQETFSNGAAFADFDLDGDLDLVVVNLDDPVSLYRNDARQQNDHHYLQVSLQGDAAGNRQGVGARVKVFYDDEVQVQEMTPTRGFVSSVEHLIHFGLGDRTKVDRLEVTWPDGRRQVLENVNADQRIQLKQADAQREQDLATADGTPLFGLVENSGLDFRHQENDFYDFDVNGLLPHRLSIFGPALATADVNADGLADVFLGGAAGQESVLYVQQSDGRFAVLPQPALTTDERFEDVDAIFFDADGDGDQDLYVVSGGNSLPAGDPGYQDRLYLNDGAGHFQRAVEQLPAMPTSGSSVTAHDFDGDGDQDLLIGGSHVPRAYPSIPRSYVLRNEGGRFADVTAEVAPAFAQVGMIRDLAWGNLDEDAELELVITGEWMPISILDFDGSQFQNVTANYGLEQSTGWWNTVALHDLDGDGDLDVLGGNFGLNSRLRPPIRIYGKDFDSNGKIDPILTWMDEGKEYPVAQRDAMFRELPILKKRFIRYAAYGTAEITTVFPDDQRTGALRFEAHHLASAWFRNEGGRFVAVELPLAAQLSSIRDFLLGDWDGDGRGDMLCVGNDYSPEVETGRMDAGTGCLLLNKEQVADQLLSNTASGFWAQRDARRVLQLTTGNGRQLILVANNNDALQVYERTGN